MAKHKLLIVDDSEQTRTLLSFYFANEFDIDYANNGEEGLKRIHDGEEVDLIFLDLVMPEVDGFEFLQRYKDMHLEKEPPVIVLTSSYSRDDELKAFQLGATEFVSKPFEPAILLKKAQVAVDSYRRLLDFQLTNLSIFDNLEESVILIDAKSCKLVFMNKAARTNSGLDEYKGKHCYEVFIDGKGRCPHCVYHEDKEELNILENEETYETVTNEGRNVIVNERLIAYDGRLCVLSIAHLKH